VRFGGDLSESVAVAWFNTSSDRQGGNFMRKQPGIANSPNGTLTVLSVSPIEEDHRCLQEIISHSNWILYEGRDLVSALAFLQQHEISVILCERDLFSETWVDILDNIRHLRHPPSLIVTSRLADERFWAEAMNLGAWDVLAKPFARSEVLRSVAQAGVHWHHQIQMPAMSLKVMTAAG
jgi:DNA-binding NtrC family response regulator